MKVANQYIVIDDNDTPQILFELENGWWYKTTNGAFGQRDMSLTPTNDVTAAYLLKRTNESDKTVRL
jgi:hypothetical protein